VDRALLELEKKCQAKAITSRVNGFSLTTWLRGMMNANHIPPIKGTNAEKDLEYFQNMQEKYIRRDLSTTATPGSYLVPTIQAAEIVALLSDYGTLRRAGCRIVPMVGIEKLTFPTALAYPTVAWIGQDTAQSPSDANLGQVQFNLKTARSLTPIPNELLAVSVPPIDAIMSEIMAIGMAELEDKAFFSTLQQTNGPNSLYAQIANLTSLLAGGNNANGGALTYNDILATMSASRKAKARGPFAWFCNPYTLYQAIAGLLDKNSRPIFDPNVVVQRLFGWPIYDTTWIAQDQANGSGSNQSYMVLTNPQYIMIGEPGTVEIAVSTEFYFDRNQVAVRGVKRTDIAIAPPKGVVILQGIN
jgi:HK97 family phage major capsid protein